MGSLKRSLANNILTSGKFDATDLTGNLPSSNIANASMTSITAFPASAGSAIALVASDPPAPTLGDVWYNTTSNAFKYAGAGVGSWATGGSMNNARRQLAGSGTQTAGLAVAGITTAFPGVNNVEEYDGSTWANATGVGTTRFDINAAGVQTATVAFGGFTTAPTLVTEEYNGSTWSPGNNLLSILPNAAACGTQTAALGAGPNHQQYDGTSWTSATALGTPRALARGAGTQTAALVFMGSSPTRTETEEWNGSSWTARGSLNTGRQGGGSTSQGTTISAAAFSGELVPGTRTTATEQYDGTSWATQTSCSTARNYTIGAGTASAGLLFGGQSPAANTGATEEYTGAGALTTKTITTS